MFRTFPASLILQLSRDKVEEFVDGDMFEVAARAAGRGHEPLEYLLVRVLFALVVRVVALPQRFFVEGHQLRRGVLEEVLPHDLLLIKKGGIH